MICALHPNAQDQDARILFVHRGFHVNQTGTRFPVIFGTEYLTLGVKVTFCITPHIVTLLLTRENGGIVIHDRLTLK